MRRLPTATYHARRDHSSSPRPTSAHHSISMFDTSQEILIEGTVARFDWVNPHMYLTVETKGPDGQAGAGRRRRPRDYAGARRRPRSGGTETRHARHCARQSQSRRLGQAGPHPGRDDSGRRDPSLLCGESPNPRPHAGREPRGTLGATAVGTRRSLWGHGAMAGHAGGSSRSGRARRRWALLFRAHAGPCRYSTSCE